MPSLLSASANEALLRRTGGVTVVKGAQTTYGHVSWEPTQFLAGSGGAGAIQSAHGHVVIAAGRLTGVTALGDGIGDSLVVDSVNVKIVGIGAPPGETDGDMLDVLIQRT
jgi:hypothetical protein